MRNNTLTQEEFVRQEQEELRRFLNQPQKKEMTLEEWQREFGYYRMFREMRNNARTHQMR